MTAQARPVSPTQHAAVRLQRSWRRGRTRAFSTASGLARSVKLGLDSALSETVPFLFGSRGRLIEARFSEPTSITPSSGKRECRLVDDDLGCALALEVGELDRFQPRKPREHRVIAIEPSGGLVRRIGREQVKLRRRWHVELGSRRAHFTDEANQPVELGLGLRIDLRLRLRPFRDDQLVGPLVRVPQLFGDEGHQRVKHHQDLVERPGCDAPWFPRQTRL